MLKQIVWIFFVLSCFIGCAPTVDQGDDCGSARCAPKSLFSLLTVNGEEAWDGEFTLEATEPIGDVPASYQLIIRWWGTAVDLSAELDLPGPRLPMGPSSWDGDAFTFTNAGKGVEGGVVIIEHGEMVGEFVVTIELTLAGGETVSAELIGPLLVVCATWIDNVTARIDTYRSSPFCASLPL